jgi:hypothetical protein
VSAPAPTSHDQHALRRARQAVRCLPFRREFYRELEQGALSSTQLAARKDWRQISRSPLSASRTEDHLIWLIQLGVLRREVDGQGLTERVRLTPLGREVLQGWSNQIPPATPLTRLKHWLKRHQPRL